MTSLNQEEDTFLKGHQGNLAPFTLIYNSILSQAYYVSSCCGQKLPGKKLACFNWLLIFFITNEKVMSHC